MTTFLSKWKESGAMLSQWDIQMHTIQAQHAGPVNIKQCCGVYDETG